MEKFSGYRDKGTGISPFMPVSDPDDDNLLITYLVRPVVFLVKLPFFLVFTVILAVVTPVSPLLKPLLSLYLKLFFNLTSTELLVDGVKKSNTKQIDAKKPQANDVVFFNFSSPLDSFVLFLISKCSSTTFYTIDGKGSLALLGAPYSCYNFALTAPKAAADPADVVPLKLEKDGSAVFIAVEGATTNNRSIMHIPKGFDVKQFVSSNPGRSFKTISIKVHPTYLLTVPMPITPFRFLYKNLSNFRFNAQYKMRLFEMDKVTEQTIRDDLSNYGKLKLLGADMDITKKEEFVESYQRTH